MKKIILMVFSVIFVLTIFPVVEAKNFNDLTSYQKQKYWVFIKECSPLLLNKEYNKYRICALAAFEKASQEKETNAWCTDSDGGKDFLTKGIVKTDIYPEGKEDYVKTFSNGATYLMEGFCSSKNQYAFAQKNCSDFGKKYYAKDGACVYENQPPVLTIAVNTTETNEGDYYEIYLYGSDADKDGLTFSAENLPEGAEINEVVPVPFPYDKEVAIFSWTPTYEQAGEYEVTFIVNDGEQSNNVTIKIVIVDVKNTWEKTFGGGNDDMAYSIQQTTDGGYIVAGMTGGGTYFKAWIFKINKKGDLEWDKTFGSGESSHVNSIWQTDDGGYIVAGSTKLKDSLNYDVWIFKLDLNGDLIWEKTFEKGFSDVAYSVQQTSDSGYIVSSQQDFWILKLDSNGNLIWEKTFGAGIPFSLQQTSDMGYVVAGAGYGDIKVLKLDSDGNLIWEKTFGGINSDSAYSVRQNTDGGYIIVGDTYSKGIGYQNVWILKLDSDGNLIWEKTFGGDGLSRGRSVQQANDGGYIVAGDTDSKGAGEFDIWILRLDSSGNLLWDKTFGGNNDDMVTTIQKTVDGGYIVASVTNSIGSGKDDAWILKLDSAASF